MALLCQTSLFPHLPSPPVTPAPAVDPPTPKGPSPQPADPPTRSHKSSQQMTYAKPESPQVENFLHRGTRRSLPSSSSQSPRRSSSRPSGVPVLEPASSSSKVQSVPLAHSATATPLVKPDMSPVPKPTSRGPHTPPEHSTPRPSHSPPNPSALPAKHEPKVASTPAQLSTETVLKNGQHQQQKSQNGKWTRQSTRRRKAQHGKRVQQVITQDPKPTQTPAPKQAQRAKPSLSSNTDQQWPRDIQRQAVRSSTDLPPKAATLTEAADRQLNTIKPANWHPLLYSAAVGPASFGADVVTPLVGNKAPISHLLDRYKGSPKYEQLNKLTKGSRPFTHYRSIRGEANVPADCAC